MTQREFDILVRQALWTGIQEDFSYAWSSNGPEPSCSKEYRQWQRKFLSDPLAAAQRGRARRRPLRCTKRIALAAALAVLLLLGTVLAVVPLLQNHWIVQVEPVTFKYSGETADYYHLNFDRAAFGLDNDTWSEEELPEFGHWYPTWLPKSYGIKLELEDVIDRPWNDWCFQRYAVPTEMDEKMEPLEDGQFYESFSVSYQYLCDGFRCSIPAIGEFSYEVVQINGHPGYIIWDTQSPLPGLRHFIWLGKDEQTVFSMDYCSDSPDNENMIRIAKSFKKDKS